MAMRKSPASAETERALCAKSDRRDRAGYAVRCAAPYVRLDTQPGIQGRRFERPRHGRVERERVRQHARVIFDVWIS
jgi:hypothetical protein